MPVSRFLVRSSAEGVDAQRGARENAAWAEVGMSNESASARDPSDAGENSAVSDRIIRAGYACFERFGISKTTIEDIAELAGVSRPTVYKYFDGKDGIVERISEIESQKVGEELRRRIVRRATTAETLTECLLISVRLASKNVYLRRILEDLDYIAQASLPTSAYHKKSRVWWGALLTDAAAQGEFANDLSLDEIISWLTLAKAMLLIKIDGVKMTDGELRRFIRRFLVDPIISKSVRSPASPARRTSLAARKRRH